VTVGNTNLSRARLRGLQRGRVSLSFKLRATQARREAARADALSESAALKRRAKARRLRSLTLRVITETARATRTTVRVQIRNLGL
jgi:hypothetical protein